MNAELARLIADYQKSVVTAVALLYRSGIPMPHSSAAWIEADFAMQGELEDGQFYRKHGAGCTVDLKSGEVDFDFGCDGEISGIDLWRLVRFCRGRLAEYGFQSEEDLEEAFKAAVASGALVYSGHCLYWIADIARVFAADIDCREPGDLLPPRDHDLVLSLYVHYFLTADFMRKNYEKLDAEFDRTGKLSRAKEVEFGIFLSTWLGFLGVTCEGFRKLSMHLLLQKERPTHFIELLPQSNEIGRMMKAHSEALREFRNDVFHLRKNSDVIRSFFARDEKRLEWARELHGALERFFSGYRILSEVHYVRHNRRGESDLFGNRRYRTKRKVLKSFS